MRMVRKVGLLVVVWVLSLAVQAGEPPIPAVSAGECWTKAMNAGDVDAVATCNVPDAVMWFPGGGMVTGREAFRKGHADYFAACTIDVARKVDGHGMYAMDHASDDPAPAAH